MKASTLAAVAVIAAFTAFADKVTFKSGSFITGKSGEIADGKLKFASDDLGDIAIDLTKIEKLESDRDHVVQYLDFRRETKKVTVAGGELAVAENGAVKKLDMSDVKAIDPVLETWHGSVNVAGSATRGNTVGESATIEGSLQRRWEHDRLTVNGGYYFAQSGDSKENKQKTVSRFELDGQEDHFWANKVYSYVNGKYEFDRLMDLEYRYRLGLGIGYQWLENRDFGFGKMSFNQELGMSYIDEKYDHVDDDNYGTFRYAHHYTWEIASITGLAFAHNFEFLPQVDEWSDNYLIDTDAGLVYAFNANWQVTAKAEWDYKKKVAPGVKHSDIRYIVGIGYKW